jgi:hypothetical protein
MDSNLIQQQEENEQEAEGVPDVVETYRHQFEKSLSLGHVLEESLIAPFFKN